MIFKEEDNDGREKVTEEEERVSIRGESTSNFGGSQVEQQ